MKLQLNSAKKNVASLEEREHTLSVEVARLRSENVRLRGTVAEHTEQVRASHEKFRQLTKDHADIDANHEKIRMQSKLQFQSQISELNQQLEICNNRIKKLSLELSEKALIESDLRNQIEASNKKHKHAVESLSDEKDAEAKHLKKRNKELQEALDNSQQQLNRLVELHKKVSTNKILLDFLMYKNALLWQIKCSLS